MYLPRDFWKTVDCIPKLIDIKNYHVQYWDSQFEVVYSSGKQTDASKDNRERVFHDSNKFFIHLKNQARKYVGQLMLENAKTINLTTNDGQDIPSSKVLRQVTNSDKSNEMQCKVFQIKYGYFQKSWEIDREVQWMNEMNLNYQDWVKSDDKPYTPKGFVAKILSEALNYKQKQIHQSVKRRAPQETLTNGKKKRRKTNNLSK